MNAEGDVVKYLVSVGADIRAKDNSRQTPLDIAKWNGSPAVVKYLSGLK